MGSRRRFSSDEMMVALFVWVCTLPVIGLLILPRFGLSGALMAALIALLALMLLCWGMCGRGGFRP